MAQQRSCRNPLALLALTYAIEVFRVAASDLAWGAQSPKWRFLSSTFAAHVGSQSPSVLSGFWVLLTVASED